MPNHPIRNARWGVLMKVPIQSSVRHARSCLRNRGGGNGMMWNIAAKAPAICFSSCVPRQVQVTAQRTARDVAYQMQALVDVHFPTAPLIRLVRDHLNTHTVAALYETFPPAAARRIARRLEWHFTPKHGSWLNMAEIEFSVLLRQCLDRRFASVDAVAHEIACWETTRNAQQATIAWQFCAVQARIKLRRLYPSSS
jgi:hypothetical protein